MKKAIVVGSGAGGATAAKELQGKFDVTVLEAGQHFRPFSFSLETMETIKRSGLLISEKQIQLFFPAMRIMKTSDKMVLVRGIGTGGTTTIGAGNALRMDADLRRLGINLDLEFEELGREIPVSTAHQRIWRETTRRLFKICESMALNPVPTPKMGHYECCQNCGRCVLGCPNGVKWDGREFLKEALAGGARLITNCRVRRILIKSGKATGVLADAGWQRRFFPADLVILAAGGMGTPAILQDSEIPCEPRLFVDPVLCVATEWKSAFQNQEVPMPFVVQREHFILSPYFDHLSFFFNRKWKSRARDILSLMIKLADSNSGRVTGNKVDKTLNDLDKNRLKDAVALAAKVFGRLGIGESSLFLGTINAGHPGGMLPLAAREAERLHPDRLPENLFVADASLFPASLGNPPSLTIMALAKRISKICRTSL